MAFGIWFVKKSNALIYIMCTLEIHGKTYGINNLVIIETNVITTYMQITVLT
jgi:hypothetical protein